MSGDTRQSSLTRSVDSLAYVLYTQQTYPGLLADGHLVVRTKVEPASVAGAVRSAIRAVNPDSAPTPRTMVSVLAESLARQRFQMEILGAFAVLALVLAAVGIFGVISYSVVQRTHEIGIRTALGAGRKEVLGMVLREGLSLALYGVAAGLAGAWALTRFIASLLYGVRPTDLFTFSLVPLVLTAVALLASYVPAHRATKVDPIVALRYE